VHNTTIGGDGDKLHPNRLGYIAMGIAIDLDLLKPSPAKSAGRETPAQRQNDRLAKRSL